MPTDPDARLARWRDPVLIQTTAAVLVIVAATWFMLIQLAPLLRPLLIAVFLSYVLMPYHRRLRTRVGTPASLGILAGVTAVLIVLLAFAVYISVIGLSDELPRLENRIVELSQRADSFVTTNVPWIQAKGGEQQMRVEEQTAASLSALARPVLNAVAGAVLEACVVGLYLLFLLLEASRFPDRIRKAYSPERADEILQVAGQVNSAIISYLKAKVKSSFALAIPVGIVLSIFGVKFAFLWAVLTFCCNFIPYIGSVVSYSLLVGFTFLWLDFDWQPFAVAALVLGCHLTCASIVEPTILGKAMGLSPLVILASLAFWGLIWGIPGMFLAVPLTVVALLVMKHLKVTRPVAQLLMEG